VIDVSIEPGQQVAITGNSAVADDGGMAAPLWGSGTLTVMPGGSLVLANIVVSAIVVQSRGRLSVTGGSIGTIAVSPNATVELNNVAYHQQTLTLTTSENLQCSQPYTTISNQAWRSPDRYTQWTADGVHHDTLAASGVGGNRWYRFTGANGVPLALPTSAPDPSNWGGQTLGCGARLPGWLSGWDDARHDPPRTYSGHGTYPTAAQGVVARTVCLGPSFDDPSSGESPCSSYGVGGDNGCYPCYYHAAVEVVRCGEFFLWRLPDAIDGAYCATQYSN
jgi:hypothetical protein